MKLRHPSALAVLFFVVFSLFLFRPYVLHHQVPFPANLLVAYFDPWKSYPAKDYPNGPANKPIGFDNLRIFYPLRHLVVDQIKHGQMPLWNPYAFSGNPLLASYQSAVFHPLSILFFLLPQIDAWSIIILLSPIFTGIGMYLFLKELRLSTTASLFGATVLAFSGFFTVWWEESFMLVYSALFLPWSLFFIEKIRQKPLARYVFLLTLSLAFSIVSGWFQMTFYSFILLIVWVICTKPSKQLVAIILGSFAIAGLLSGIHLVPSFEAFGLSLRQTADAKYLFTEYLVPLQHLITFIAPDFFGSPGTYNYYGTGFYHEKVLFFGLVPFIFALYTLLLWKKHTRIERFFSLTFLITLSLGCSLPTSWLLLYQLKLPFLSVIIPSRIFFLTTVSGAVLSAFGLSHLFETHTSKKPLVLSAILVGIALTASWAIALYLKFIHARSDIATTGLRNLVIPSGIYMLVIVGLTISKALRNQKILTIGIFALTLVSSALFAQKYLYFSDPNLVFPQVPVLAELKNRIGNDRFWSYQYGYIENNFASMYGIATPEGYDSLYIRRYGELLNYALTHGNASDAPRADAKIESTDTFTEILKNPFRQKLLALLDVRYIVGATVKEREAPAGVKKAPNLTPAWHDDTYAIYTNETALPHAFLAYDFVVKQSDNQILQTMFDKATDLSKTLVLESQPPFEPSSSAHGQATITSYTPNRMVIQTLSIVPALLFLSDSYYPGWNALVDGTQTKIYRANYAFRSVVVPAGSHTVQFVYAPHSLIVGAITSTAGILMLGIVITGLFIASRRKR